MIYTQSKDYNQYYMDFSLIHPWKILKDLMGKELQDSPCLYMIRMHSLLVQIWIYKGWFDPTQDALRNTSYLIHIQFIDVSFDSHTYPPLWQKVKRLKSLLMKVKEESKSWHKAQHSENKDHGIWSHHFMGNRWGNSRNSVRLYFFGSKITVDGDCSHEIKRCLLLRSKVMTNLDSIFKRRDIQKPRKVCLVKVMVFPVVRYGCERWTVKKAKC